MRLRQHHGLVAGISALAAGAAVLQIALLFQYRAILGPPFALVALGLPFLGGSLGALVLAAYPAIARPATFLSRLASLASLAAATTLAALLVIIHLRPFEVVAQPSNSSLALICLSSALPFAAVGIAILGTVRHAPRILGSLSGALANLSAAVLGGAAGGGLLAVALLSFSALRLSLVASIVDALAGLLFYAAARLPPEGVLDAAWESRPLGTVVSAVALASVVVLLGDLGAPWLKVARLRFANVEHVDVQRWSELGFVTVDRPSLGLANLRTDGIWATPIFDDKAALPSLPDEMGYALRREPGPTLVLGRAPDRDVRLAIRYGMKDVHVVEIDPVIAHDVIGNRYQKLGGEPPQVNMVVAGPRAYLRRTPLVFQRISIPFGEGGPAWTSGALELHQTDLFTIEGFADLLAHLTRDGTVTITLPTSGVEPVAALARDALRRDGAADPNQNLFACTAGHATTLLMKRAALTAPELAQIHGMCRGRRLPEVMAPDAPPGRSPQPNARPDDRTTAPPEPLLATDDRPFAFATVPLRRLPAALRAVKTLPSDHQGLFTLMAMLIAGLVLGATTAATALTAPDSVGGRVRPALFVAALGAAVPLVALGLGPSVVMLLGHPSHAISTVAVFFLLAAAIAGLRTAHVPTAVAQATAGRLAQLALTVIALEAAFMGLLMSRVGGLPLAARLAIGVVLLAIAAAPLGALTALGLRILAARAPTSLAACASVGAAAAFVAVAVATLISVELGFSTTLLVGAATLVVVAASVPSVPEGF